MREHDVIRAWIDPEYRSTLNADALSRLPSHPSGLIELTDETLASASGLAGPAQTTAPECTMYTAFAGRRCCPK